jgi:hypothetical protein
MEQENKSLSSHLREALRSPMVIFALAVALIAAVGAPLFAVSDLIN